MNNEPVAYVDPIWMQRPDLVMAHQLEIAKLFARTKFGHSVPLYTHPMRELTDEEIGQFKGEWYRGDYASFYDLVRAILKKASEK